VKSILGFLANLLLFLSISTLLFSVAAYLAFKIKGKRKPKVRAVQNTAAASASIVQPELLQEYVQAESNSSKPSDKQGKAKARVSSRVS
jgi:hypothetical protein